MIEFDVDVANAPLPPTPIEDGRRMALFLADPAVVGAFRRLEEQYFGEFRRAKSVDLTALHAKVAALGDLRDALAIVVDTGTFQAAADQHREKLAALKRRPGPR